jgi:lipopolysaccharide/colanic/teichoic acid biosynthesis glycosyltransferase
VVSTNLPTSFLSKSPLMTARVTEVAAEQTGIHPSVESKAKRLIDIAGALVGLSITAVWRSRFTSTILVLWFTAKCVAV